ncbi:MAG: ADOP family duplicated permease [Opitutales bacterium]
MSAFWQDLLYAFRVLFKRPGPTFLAIVALALSIGLTTTTFSVFNGFVFKGFPHPDGHRLFQVRATASQQPKAALGLPANALEVIAAEVPAFAASCGFFIGTINYSGDERGPVRVEGTYITPGFLEVVREPVLLGQAFHELAAEELSDAILLSFEMWKERYRGDESVIGRTVRINGEPRVIRGVMPEGFVFPFYSEVWTPLPPALLEAEAPGVQLTVVGRLADEATSSALEAQLDAARHALLGGADGFRDGVEITRFGDLFGVVRSDGFVFGVQIAIMIGLLLIACANVANLLLGRAAARSRELAVRAALGASRRRLILQLLVESLVLACLGTIGGLLFTVWQVDFDAQMVSSELPRWLSFNLDWRVYAFVAGMVVVVSLLAGILPALQASKTDLNEMLKDGARTSTSFRITRFTKILTIGQIAFSCALLFGAGLAARQLLRMQSWDLVIDAPNILTMRLALFESDYPDEASRTAFVDEVLTRVERVPGVEAATMTTWISEPGSGISPVSLQIVPSDGKVLEDTPMHFQPMELVTPRYFEVYEATLQAGRVFTPADHAPEAAPTVLVNEAFVAKHFPAGDALGRELRLYLNTGDGLPELTPARIVGVVENLYLVLHSLNLQDVPPQIYVPLQQATPRFITLAVRGSNDDAHSLAEPVTAALQDIDPHLPPYFVRTMSDYYETMLMPFRMFVVLFLFVGTMALFLAAVGVYSLMAFSVSLRRQEFGVRMAVGARRRNLVQMVLREGLTQLIVGVTAGLGIALSLGFAVSRVLQASFRLDPLLLGTILAVLSFATLLALLIPLRRTARLSPMEALRYE